MLDPAGEEKLVQVKIGAAECGFGKIEVGAPHAREARIESCLYRGHYLLETLAPMAQGHGIVTAQVFHVIEDEISASQELHHLVDSRDVSAGEDIFVDPWVAFLGFILGYAV